LSAIVPNGRFTRGGHPNSFAEALEMGGEEGRFLSADFSMRRIEILRPTGRRPDVSINSDHKPYYGGSPMNPECSPPRTPSYCQEDLRAPSSRLLDEKISDDSGAETKIDSALKPTGLNNPFWK
jgi:hypothetical protein